MVVHLPQCNSVFGVKWLHSSLDDPPNTSMFMRAGGASVTKKDPNSMAQALTQAAS